MIILMINSSGIRAAGKDKDQSALKYPLMYMIMIATPEEEKLANGLIESIKEFGGSYSVEPVVVVLSDTAKTRGESLKGKVMALVELEMNETLRRFPFSDKVYACAQIEKMMESRTDWLVWLNPDALVVAPPSEILAGNDSWVSLRPVHIKNIGIDSSVPLNEFWKKIYRFAAVDTNSLWSVESYVDNKILSPYYNSGCMAFRPEKGILREWERVYESMLIDKDIYSFYSSDSYGAFFFHQAVLSAVVTAKAGKSRINILPPSYGYPLLLQNNDDFINKKNSVTELKVILCGSYDNLKWLRPEEPYNTWILKNIQ